MHLPTHTTCAARPPARGCLRHLLLLPALLAALVAAPRASADTGEEGLVRGRLYHGVTRDALVGATVRLVELGRETTTERDGSFSFPRVPAGSYTLLAAYEGLQSE